jgi:hypothetical protein
MKVQSKGIAMISNTEFRAIVELDLDPIKVKLMHKESGEGWALEYANTVEFEYRRFLYLMKMFPNEQIAPLFDVDVFWHYHILDTLKYAADCETVFGYFLHHFPYVGLRGDDDQIEHELAGNRMRELYEATFGDAYVGTEQVLAADGRTAWCVKDSGNALPLANTRTAWCVKDSGNALPLANTRTAWCVKESRKALPLADTRTAWCVKESRKALPLADTRTAWCVLANTEAAWPVKVAGGARSEADAASVRPLPVANSAQAQPTRRFNSARPVLVTPA